MDDRTVRLSPGMAALAQIMLDAIDMRPGENIPEVLETVTEIMGRARRLAVQVTRLWDEASDKQRIEEAPLTFSTAPPGIQVPVSPDAEGKRS